jgi:predicted outer membrane repeat protein
MMSLCDRDNQGRAHRAGLAVYRQGSWLFMEVRSWRRGISVAAATGAGVLAMSGVARALPNPVTVFTVSDSTDAALANPSGTSCVSTDAGECTLRAAVQAADNVGGTSQITVPAGTYKLTIPSTGANDPATGDLDIQSGVSVTITGAGSASTIINAAGIDRAFAVQNGASLSVAGMTIKNGAQPASGASNNSTDPGYGGAIYNDGTLAVSSSALSGNSSGEDGGAVFSDVGAVATTISGSSVSSNSAFQNGGAISVVSGTLSLSTDTITHNSAYYDGGAINDDESGNTVGAITIDSTTISNNVSDDPGGAIYLDDAGALTVSNSTLDNNNSGNDEGGAIYDEGPVQLTITDSTFLGDTAGDDEGGAVYTDATDLAVTGSTFTNDQSNEGGALYIDGTSATAVQTITTSTFTDNSATDDEGGAVYDDYGDLQITGSTFTGNDSGVDGGALYYDSGDGLALTNDTFDGNQATYGGALYLGSAASTGTIALLNDTITRDTAYEGGGIYDPQLANSIENTIVAGNSGGTGAQGGGDCYAAATDSAGVADLGGNIDSDGTCFSASVTGDQVNVDPMLGQLTDNGGPTETDIPEIGSPAIGTALASLCPAVDQRGITRSGVQGQCDSGAVQTAPASLTLANTAPGSSSSGYPFDDTITASNGGPGPSTGTTIVDQLAANTTLYGVTPSQGTCTTAGTPATVTCDLGVINNGSQATVALVIAATGAGTVTNTATATNDQGQSPSATASTQVTVPATTTTTTTTTPSSSSSSALTGPTATSMAPATGSVTRTGAGLTGQLVTGGQSTAYFFQYGRTTGYGQATAVQSTATAQTVSAALSGLHYNAKYHYRLVAINSAGISYGADQTFTTALRTKANKVGLSVAKSTTKQAPYRYTLAGKLTLPRGITQATGCVGKVTITITNGTKKLVAHTIKVTRTCSYQSTFNITKTLAKNAKLQAKASFGGNLTLYGTKSGSLTLRHC